MTREIQRYFGRIIFPENNHTINDVWLTINGNKIFVELGDPYLKKEDWDIVLGEFNKIGTISLLECELGSQTMGFGGNERKLVVHKIVQGIKLERLNDSFLSSISLKSSALDKWIRINSSIDWTENSISIPELNEILNIKCSNFQLKLIVGHDKYYSVKKSYFERNTFFDVQFTNKINIRDYFIWKNHLEKLVVYLTNDNPELEILSINNQNHKIFGINSNWESNQFSYYVSFEYLQLSENLPNIFKQWFEIEKLQPVINLITERKANTSLSVPRYYLNNCVALESFHRNFIKNNVELVDNNIILNRDKIKDAIKGDEDLLKWFRAKTSFWKKPELFDRLIDMKEEFEKVIGNIFSIQTEILLNMIKNTRNKLAHEGKHLTEFNSEFELYIVAYALELFLQIQIIKILGVNNNEVLGELYDNANNNLKLSAEWNNYRGIETKQ